MTPPTVNAYYNPRPQLWRHRRHHRPRTHSFDDQGRQFDAQGNLKDGWTEKDASAYEDRINCIRAQYDQYTIVDDIKINSKLTPGEDVADLGGKIVAWLAWKAATKTRHMESMDGLTPLRRYGTMGVSVAYGPRLLRMRALTDPYSPHQRSGREHARAPAGVLPRGWPADGQPEGM